MNPGSHITPSDELELLDDADFMEEPVSASGRTRSSSWPLPGVSPMRPKASALPGVAPMAGKGAAVRTKPPSVRIARGSTSPAQSAVEDEWDSLVRDSSRKAASAVVIARPLIASAVGGGATIESMPADLAARVDAVRSAIVASRELAADQARPRYRVPAVEPRLPLTAARVARFVATALLGAVAGAALVFMTACTSVSMQHADAMAAAPPEPLGEDRLALKWKFSTADRLTEIDPQEFAVAAVYADTVYIGSQGGQFFALKSATGAIRWRKQLGAVTSQPVVSGGVIYLGTADGILMALDAATGEEKWHYQSRGPVSRPPVVTLQLVVFSNEADQVVALDSITGQFKWQFKGETPEEYTLRGHAGVAIDGDLIYTGFSNGTLVALRKDTGSVAWSTSLKAEADRFMDVDATPLVVKNTVYATSSSGGVYALDKATGLVRWRVPFYDAFTPSATGNIGGLASDGKAIYVNVADLGTYAIDLDGNVIWRVGARGGGEPGEPVVWNELLVYSLAHDGMFLADRRTGETLEYFDPGDGISAAPAITGDGRLYVMSNRGILYAFDLD